MKNTSKEPTAKDPIFKRYSVDSINIYEVTDSDLEIIERGSSNLIFLNFAIFLISIAASFLIALLTCDYKSIPTTQTIFLLITIVGFVIGIFCIILWFRTKDDVKHVISKIKGRLDQPE